MGSNQGSRNSPNSGSFNFRFIHKHARLAAFALMAAILFSPGQSQAYWRTCFPNPANCSTSSAQASCQSYAWFYSSPYYFLIYIVRFSGLTINTCILSGQYVPLAWFRMSIRQVAAHR